MASRAASTSSVTTTEQLAAISNDAGRTPLGPSREALGEPAVVHRRRPSGRSRSAASRRRSRRPARRSWAPRPPARWGDRAGSGWVIGFSGFPIPRAPGPVVGEGVVRARVGDRSLASQHLAHDVDVLARARQRLPERRPVPALHHLRARHPEAEHEATLREVVEGEGVHRARRSASARRSARWTCRGGCVEVCDPHHASGPNASLPQDSAVNTVSNPRRSASRIRSRASVGGLAPQYPSVSPSFIRADPSSANVAEHPRTRSRGGLGCADRAMDVARGGGSGCASTSCCSSCSP